MPALEAFFGSKAGLFASVITRLTATSQEEQRRFAERDLSGVDDVYLRVDGVHVTVRLDEDRVCTLVMVGVRADGKKELVAVLARQPGREHGRPGPQAVGTSLLPAPLTDRAQPDAYQTAAQVRARHRRLAAAGQQLALF